MVAAPDAAIGIHSLIRGQECAQVDDRWHSALNADIGKVVHTDIRFIFQQDKTVFIPTSATTGFQALIVQLSGNVYKRHAGSGFAENISDDLSVRLVNRKAAIRALAVAEGDRTGIYFAVFGIEAHPTANVLSKRCTIILGRTFQNGFQQDTLGAVRDGSLCIENPDTSFFELIFISGRIVPIAGEAVDLPADHEGPVAVGRILQHLLELGPVIGSAGQMPIGVDLHDPETVLLRKKFAVSHLLLNGTVPLGMGRVTCIDHRVLNIRIGYRRKFLFHGFPQLVR